MHHKLSRLVEAIGWPPNQTLDKLDDGAMNDILQSIQEDMTVFLEAIAVHYQSRTLDSQKEVIEGIGRLLHGSLLFTNLFQIDANEAVNTYHDLLVKDLHGVQLTIPFHEPVN